MRRAFARPGGVAVLVGAVCAVAPAMAPADELVAAYEFHNGANGFDIGIVNAATGQALVVPPTVNSTADEFHPALTTDGRYLVFTRATLTAQPDGDIVPPAARQVLMLDRQTREIRAPFAGRSDAGAGATSSRFGQAGSILAFGVRVQPGSSTQQIVVAGTFTPTLSPPGFSFTSGFGTLRSDLGAVGSEQSGTFVDVPQAAVGSRTGGLLLKATATARFSEGNGSATNPLVMLVATRTAPATPQTLILQNTVSPRHPVPRFGDGHVALDTTTSTGTDIATVQHPGDTTASPFTAVNTADPERMPAWSPDGVQLGFVRTPASATPRRQLLVFDSTLGLQTIVNPAVDLGPEAPTPQLREYQAIWGGLSLAAASANDSVVITCGAACGAGLAGGGATGVGIALRPTLGRVNRVPVGIFIARRTGTHRVFGRRVARIRTVGRVPLGVANRRRPLFRWDGRVNGRRLSRGTYFLTFRALDANGRILDTSGSLRFRVTRSGRITRVRRV